MALEQPQIEDWPRIVRKAPTPRGPADHHGLPEASYRKAGAFASSLGLSDHRVIREQFLGGIGTPRAQIPKATSGSEVNLNRLGL